MSGPVRRRDPAYAPAPGLSTFERLRTVPPGDPHRRCRKRRSPPGSSRRPPPGPRECRDGVCPTTPCVQRPRGSAVAVSQGGGPRRVGRRFARAVLIKQPCVPLRCAAKPSASGGCGGCSPPASTTFAGVAPRAGGPCRLRRHRLDALADAAVAATISIMVRVVFCSSRPWPSLSQAPLSL